MRPIQRQTGSFRLYEGRGTCSQSCLLTTKRHFQPPLYLTALLQRPDYRLYHYPIMIIPISRRWRFHRYVRENIVSICRLCPLKQWAQDVPGLIYTFGVCAKDPQIVQSLPRGQ